MSTRSRKSHQPIENLFVAAYPRVIIFAVKNWEQVGKFCAIEFILRFISG